MDLSKFHLNYATVKRRGYDVDTYEYIYTVHSYPVRMAGFEDIKVLKAVNSKLDSGILTDSDDDLRFAASLSRSRSRVLQLAFNNKWDYFVTLTFNKDKIDRYDYKAICAAMLKFFDNYKQRKSKDFKYLLIPEQHKDGAFHFHGYFANVAPGDVAPNEHNYLDFMPYRKKFGFCSISPIEDREKCAVYVSKYITKDMFLNVPPAGTHLYFASRGLKYDVVVSCGSALVDFKPSSDCTEQTFAYCTKYTCKRNIFTVVPFADLDPVPELPSAADLDSLRIASLYKFCNEHNIYLNEKTNLMRKYNALKDSIIGGVLNKYDMLREHYAELRAEWLRIYNMSEEEIETIFAGGIIDDLVMPSVLQNDCAASDPVPLPPKPVIQLSLFDDEEGLQ